jgi:hypothetical protein
MTAPLAQRNADHDPRDPLPTRRSVRIPAHAIFALHENQLRSAAAVRVTALNCAARGGARIEKSRLLSAVLVPPSIRLHVA